MFLGLNVKKLWLQVSVYVSSLIGHEAVKERNWEFSLSIASYAIVFVCIQDKMSLMMQF